MMKKRMILVAVMACVAMVTSTAWADTELLQFAYNNFAGNFNSGTNLFSVTADAGTSGWMARLDNGTKTDTDFADTTNIGQFKVVADITVSAITATSAVGTGNFQIIDVNGDKITATIDGTWLKIDDTWASFSGSLSNIAITPVNSTFEGTDGKPVSLNFTSYGFPPAVLSGAIVELDTGRWFATGSFDSRANVNGSISVVPAPGAVLLIGIGLGLVGWLKRRLA